MTGADEVEPRLLHLAHLADLCIVEGHGTQHTVVVVYAGTVDKQGLAIKHKTLFGRILNGADSVCNG